jgi:hypothetical protein
MLCAMADLEELALKRDRGYLLRLVLVLAVSVVLAVALLRVLTGSEAKGCAADALVGTSGHEQTQP